MRKKSVVILASLLSATLLFTSCGGGGGDSGTTVPDGAFALPHADGSNTENGYDTELLFKNNSDFWGGDSGIIWVPEKEGDPDSGYFYQYMSGCAGVGTTGQPMINRDGEEVIPSIAISRSKDLNDWTLCGAVDGGFGMQSGLTDWLFNYVWAPETYIWPEDGSPYAGKYFMYFSAATRQNDGSIPGAEYANSNNWHDRLSLGIAVSDTPQGPFELVTSENVYGDATAKNPYGQVITSINPPIMFRNWFGLDYEYSGIDLHPFCDEDGTFYLYFSKHTSSSTVGIDGAQGNQVWGIRMIDPITPDYYSLRKCVPNVKRVGTTNLYSYTSTVYKGKTEIDPVTGLTLEDPEYPCYLDESYIHTSVFADGRDGSTEVEDLNDGTVCEAPQMLTTKDQNGDTVYILTYSPRGVGAASYDVKWAYSRNPLGPYVKPSPEQGSTLLGLDQNNDFMSNLGHVQFLHVDDEWWIAHWEWRTFGGDKPDEGRIYALSSMTWIENSYSATRGDVWNEPCLNANGSPILDNGAVTWQPSNIQFKVPVANGPHNTVQPAPSIYTGYTNIAGQATVTATNEVKGSDSLKYLTDGHVVTWSVYEDREFKANNSSTITLTFETPVTIRGVLVYNSYTYENAFNKVDSIEFTLANPPAWFDTTATSCYIKNLGIPASSINELMHTMRPGSAAAATFNEITVSEIKIKISDLIDTTSKELRISEIMVLGKKR